MAALSEAGEEQPKTLGGKRAVRLIKDFAKKQSLTIKNGPYSLGSNKYEAQLVPSGNEPEWIRCSVGASSTKQTYFEIFHVRKEKDNTAILKRAAAKVDEISGITYS